MLLAMFLLHDEANMSFRHNTLKPMSHPGLDELPWIVRRSAGVSSLDGSMHMSTWAELGTELLVERLVVGLDEPLLVKVDALRVAHVVVAAVDSASKVHHGLLMPTTAWMCPFPVDEDVGILQ